MQAAIQACQRNTCAVSHLPMKLPLITALAASMIAAAQGSSPLDLSITSFHYPQIEVTVKNTDPRRTLGVWHPGTSWGDPAWTLEFHERHGRVLKEKAEPSGYFSNWPGVQPIKPQDSAKIQFDVSKPGWHITSIDTVGLKARVVLHQAFDVDGYRQELFIGESTSPWVPDARPDDKAACTERNPFPPHTSGTPFPLKAFFSHLGSLHAPAAQDKLKLLDWLGPNWPWDGVVVAVTDGFFLRKASSITLLFEGTEAVSFFWPKDVLSPSDYESWGFRDFDDGWQKSLWAPAIKVLGHFPAAGISQISNGSEAKQRLRLVLQPDGSFAQQNLLQGLRDPDKAADSARLLRLFPFMKSAEGKSSAKVVDP